MMQNKTDAMEHKTKRPQLVDKHLSSTATSSVLHGYGYTHGLGMGLGADTGMGMDILTCQKPIPMTTGCGFSLFPAYALIRKVAQPLLHWVSLQSTTSLNHTPICANYT
jgi:hypothetical protein